MPPLGTCSIQAKPLVRGLPASVPSMVPQYSYSRGLLPQKLKFNTRSPALVLAVMVYDFFASIGVIVNSLGITY